MRERVESIERDLRELEAAVQAVRGYAGNVRAVNREVESNAELAIERVDDLERRVEAIERTGSPGNPAPSEEGPTLAEGRDETTRTRPSTTGEAPAVSESDPQGGTATGRSGDVSGGPGTDATARGGTAADEDIDEAVRADAADGLAAVLEESEETSEQAETDDGVGARLAGRIRDLL